METNSSNNYCVIMAGGRGRRLWPSSRVDRPKQFIDFFGTGRSLLQQTFDRFSRVIPLDHIYITTSQEYLGRVRQQLPDVPAEHVLAEPVNRNTAPAVAWAGRRIHRESDDARIVIAPADQVVLNEEAFERNVLHGLNFVATNDIILTMGIQPTRPEPGYGYIQIGEPTLATGISKVQSFTEKPEREFARMFMESGEFLWNTGMFMTNIRHLREWYLKVIPDMPSRLADLQGHYSLDDEARYVQQHYPSYPNLSMDKAALELSDNAYVMKCDFGWADIGTWHAIYEYLQKTENDNVVLADSEVVMEDCRNNIVCLPKGHIGVINGLDGYIVAEWGDVLLVCPKGDSSALIRKYVNEVGIKYGERFV
ncbi:MAG: mannose-1-phosphate guanylyltransferase [Prevotella sp.]|nr:mannose-1-phosphate guanylyltransferase [Prevotella sp.]